MTPTHLKLPSGTNVEIRWGERTWVMAVLNMTPDSFSGDGWGVNMDGALAQARAFQEAGADILDIGGESTRPGSVPVEPDLEQRRVLPFIDAIVKDFGIPVSVDTYKSSVAERSITAGAVMINDIWGLKRDPRIADVAAKHGTALVLMHNQEGTEYRDLVSEVLESLSSSIDVATRAGVRRDRIIVDPGFGFGKTASHNLELLGRLDELKVLGQPLLIGTSRKSTIGLVLDLPVGQRLEGTAATVAIAISKGVDIVRVHDVGSMVRVARMSDAIVRGWTTPS